MSHDNRFPKTNYLKTNLLKQIKKISLAASAVFFIYLRCKVTKKANTRQAFLLKFARFYSKKHIKRDYSVE